MKIPETVKRGPKTKYDWASLKKNGFLVLEGVPKTTAHGFRTLAARKGLKLSIKRLADDSGYLAEIVEG